MVNSLAQWWLLKKPVLKEIGRQKIVSFLCVLSLVPPSFLDPSSIPVLIVMLLVQPLLPLTAGKPSGAILQHLQSSFTPQDLPSSIVFVAGKVVPLGVVIVLLHAYKQQAIFDIKTTNTANQMFYLPCPENCLMLLKTLSIFGTWNTMMCIQGVTCLRWQPCI